MRGCSFVFLVFTTIVSNSDGNTETSNLYYKEHRIRTEQLCPDLQESTKARDIDTANYPYKSVFKLAEQVWRTADPCIFEARGVRNTYTTVAIKAIQADSKPWNYSLYGAQPCSDHIKLRLPNRRIFSKTGLPICTVKKPTEKNPAKLFQGPFYNPHIWQLSKQKMGISFSIYENDTMGDTKDEDDEEGSNENEISQPNGFLLNAKLPKFIYIVFATFYGETCSLRVQQYLIDATKGSCNASVGRTYALCGMYNCSLEEKVLKQAGFWSDSLRISELQKLIDYMRSKQYRQSAEPSIMDFFVNLMRLMVMPIIFLAAYYVTRQLREKLANRQHVLQMRSQHNINRHRAVVHVPPTVESPSSTRRERFEDPPPSYDTIITPPTYLEATMKTCTIVKTESLLQALPSTSFDSSTPPPQILHIHVTTAEELNLDITIASSTSIPELNISSIEERISTPTEAVIEEKAEGMSQMPVVEEPEEITSQAQTLLPSTSNSSVSEALVIPHKSIGGEKEN